MYFVYIMANKHNGTLYIGVTSDLLRRVSEHKGDVIDGFTKRYGLHDLVYFEPHESIDEAILREKKLKRWQRDWKRALIERENPAWRDLYGDLCAG